MASVNFLKLKGGSDVSRILRHCDQRERLQRDHKNIHIDKSLTDQNGQMKSRGGYKKTFSYYTNRINELDATTNTNKRKDRVTAFALEVPAPEGMPIQDFANIVGHRIAQMYGMNNIVNLYVHQDEQHQYFDHGEIKTSRNHVHGIVIPEINGKLDGKHFSSRARMKQLNRLIDADCREKGYIFLTGVKPRHRSVEELKRASDQELLDYEHLQGKYERLRAFCDDLTMPDGKSVTQAFDKSERQMQKNNLAQDLYK